MQRHLQTLHLLIIRAPLLHKGSVATSRRHDEPTVCGDHLHFTSHFGSEGARGELEILHELGGLRRSQEGHAKRLGGAREVIATRVERVHVHLPKPLPASFFFTRSRVQQL